MRETVRDRDRLEHIVEAPLSLQQALDLVWQYKQVIAPRFDERMNVYLYGSYSKGLAGPDSDIDVAVIVPTYGDKKMEWSSSLWHDVDKVSLLIEPVLMESSHPSPLYDDVMRTGIVI